MSVRRRHEDSDSDSDEEQQPSSRRRLDSHPVTSDYGHPSRTTISAGSSTFRDLRDSLRAMRGSGPAVHQWTPATTISAGPTFFRDLLRLMRGPGLVVHTWTPATSASTSAVSDNTWRPIEPTRAQLISSFASAATTTSVPPLVSFTTSFPTGSPWRDSRLPLVEDPEPGSELSQFRDRNQRSIALLPSVPSFYQLGRTQPSSMPLIQGRTRSLRLDERILDISGVDPKFLSRTYPRTTFYSRAYEELKGTDEKCEICFSELFDEDETIDDPWKITATQKNDWLAITQCRKAYHRNCLYRWLASGAGELKTCTNCRGKDIIFLISKSLGYEYSYLRKIRG